MKFAKDILVLDFEGLAEPVQVGAVLLDRETLKEKDAFSTYIWADLQGAVKAVTGISQDTLEGAPTQAEAGRMLYERFGSDVLLACWVAQADMRNFDKLIAAAGIAPKQYDYHVFDIWPAAYLHLLKQGYVGTMRSEEIFRQFGAKARGLHDALEDCRIAADVLRRIAVETDSKR